jgi:dTDP-glucose pyrophosphorylase
MLANKIVILAAGRGTRMRQSDPHAQLSQEQNAAAALGVKALIPIERPFLDYVLDRIADAGFRQVCLVIGPDHHELREYYSQLNTQRLAIQFATQREPLGTAHAVLAASDFVGAEPFVVLNSDNYYPTEALTALRQASGYAMVGYDRDALIANGNISADRVARFAIVETDGQSNLRNIIEKPNPAYVAQLSPPILVSMNCWRFEPTVFDACRAIRRSDRGEYELPDAVMTARHSLGRTVRVIPSSTPVLDLSHQRDVAAVAARLRGKKVRL